MSSSNTKAFNLVRHFINLLTKNQTFPDTLTRIRLEFTRGTNPLTGLPGNIPLEQELLRRTAENQPVSIIYVKLCKKNKEKYGFTGGNHVTLFTSKILSNVVKKYGGEKDFLAHIKGNDFIIITEKERADTLCTRTIKYFDSLIRSVCKREEREKNKSSVFNQEEWFPFITMVIIERGKGEKTDLKIISKKAEQLNCYAEPVHGSICVREPWNRSI